MKNEKYGRMSLWKLIVCLLSALAGWAQNAETEPIRPVTSAYTTEVGTGHLADTYLTPLHYNGVHVGLRYERTQAMKSNPEHWIMQLSLGLWGDITKNPAKNATMGNAMLQFSWGTMRRWTLAPRLSLGIGPAISLSGGCLYLDRNGNNPCSARGAVTIDAIGYASYSHTLWGLPMTLRYQAQLPAIGTFFSPEYGQLYYQIYLGDTEGLVHTAWWGNYFLLDNLATADLHFGATTLRLGYHCRIFSSKVNNLVARDVSHSFVIGVVCDWISLTRGKRLPDARIISAY